MVCVCCGERCDGTFQVLGHAVCFNCAMNESYENVMTLIRQKLNINVNTWSVATTP